MSCPQCIKETFVGRCPHGLDTSLIDPSILSGGVNMLKRGRYEIKYGKYGAYFYDNTTNKDLTLEDVLVLLDTKDNPPKVEKVATLSESQFEALFDSDVRTVTMASGTRAMDREVLRHKLFGVYKAGQ